MIAEGTPQRLHHPESIPRTTARAFLTLTGIASTHPVVVYHYQEMLVSILVRGISADVSKIHMQQVVELFRKVLSWNDQGRWTFQVSKFVAVAFGLNILLNIGLDSIKPKRRKHERMGSCCEPIV